MATADAVQYHLEAFVPDLKEYESLGYFTKSQMTSIVKKITELEYSIAKRIPRKLDHLNYISYLCNLESLRVKKKARLGLQGQYRKCDDAIVSRIHSLFRKMLQRFKGDTCLWVEYLEYCKKVGSTSALATWFAKAIQTFPTKELFWIMAANWEYERNSNMKSARVLMQRGLRMNPDNQKMWLEYCKLELIYLQKLVDRHKILLKKDLMETNETEEKENEEESQSDDDDEGASAEPIVVPKTVEEESAANVLSAEDEKTLNQDMDDNKAKVTASLSAMQQTLSQQLVPRAIYRNAIKAIPNDVDFRVAFLDLYKTMGIGSGPAAQDVYTSLEGDFGTSPKVVFFLIQSKHLSKIDSSSQYEEEPEFPDTLRSMVSAYIEALQKMPCSELLGSCVGYLRNLKPSDPNLTLYIQAITEKLFLLVESSMSSSQAENESELIEMYKLWVEFDPRVSDRLVKRFPRIPEFWMKQAHTLGDQGQTETKETCFKEAVRAVPLENGRHLLWIAYAEFMISTYSFDAEKIHAVFKSALSMFELGGREGESSLLDMYLEWSVSQGQDTFHKTMDILLSQGRQYPCSFYKKCIELETTLSTASSTTHVSSNSLSRLDKLWSLYTSSSPKDVDAWIGFIQFLFKVKRDFSEAGKVYYKACSVVEDRGYLDRRYTELSM